MAEAQEQDKDPVVVIEREEYLLAQQFDSAEVDHAIKSVLKTEIIDVMDLRQLIRDELTSEECSTSLLNKVETMIDTKLELATAKILAAITDVKQAVGKSTGESKVMSGTLPSSFLSSEMVAYASNILINGKHDTLYLPQADAAQLTECTCPIRFIKKYLQILCKGDKAKIRSLTLVRKAGEDSFLVDRHNREWLRFLLVREFPHLFLGRGGAATLDDIYSAMKQKNPLFSTYVSKAIYELKNKYAENAPEEPIAKKRRKVKGEVD